MSKNPKKIDQLVQAPQIQNYQSKPVQSFGLDLLKRMGFTQERGIGFNKQNALNQPLILKPRPKGLGLGAKPSDAVDQKPQFSKKDCIIVKTGPHEGMIGIIKKIKKQQDVLTIQLGLSGTQIKLKFSQVQKITSSEYQEKKEKLVKQNKQRNEDNQKKKKRLKWVLPHILCKIIDKLSPYYLKKLIINEILNERQFESILISQTGQKKYLKDITQKQLQTVLPKAGGIVLILDKKYRGQKAKVLQRNKEKGQVIVQVLETLQIEKFNEDDLSEFVQI